ncbi:HNH endonuclease [Mobiluncus curtisii]|uniref:HNH endonuclease n=1 Tax=Mobiluncus curtisii TaxID=2051 RepID=UPI002431D0DC|nr:HNH endonuclease signature motif containing protein [Mobiluncus curtisii]
MNKLDPVVRMRANVVAREDGRCFRCGKQVAIYEDETYHNLPVVKRVDVFSFHHRKPRGMGGSNSPDINISPNLIVLCGTGTSGCHGWVESHREQAYKEGLLIHSGIGNPILTPAFSEYRKSWIDLTTGKYIVATPPEIDE